MKENETLVDRIMKLFEYVYSRPAKDSESFFVSGTGLRKDEEWLRIDRLSIPPRFTIVGYDISGHNGDSYGTQTIENPSTELVTKLLEQIERHLMEDAKLKMTRDTEAAEKVRRDEALRRSVEEKVFGNRGNDS